MEFLYILIAIVIGAATGYGVYVFQKSKLKEAKRKIDEEVERILEEAKKRSRNNKERSSS